MNESLEVYNIYNDKLLIFFYKDKYTDSKLKFSLKK